MSTLIVIPARQGSTRLPGKPLIALAGHTLLARAIGIGRQAASQLNGARLVVATDDETIAAAARGQGIESVLTSASLDSGSARAHAAYMVLGGNEDIIVNLQGDAVFTPPGHVEAIVRGCEFSGADVTTPAVRLTWEQLDALRVAKANSPSSGTTCIGDDDGRAIWFSKAVIPFIRNESTHRDLSLLSPVRQHVGLYCYRPHILAQMLSTPPSPYEQIEGLEQLRLLAMGVDLRLVDVPAGRVMMSGIDTPADLRRAEDLIARYGDPHLDR